VACSTTEPATVSVDTAPPFFNPKLLLPYMPRESVADGVGLSADPEYQEKHYWAAERDPALRGAKA
jgi:hypothetical protein